MSTVGGLGAVSDAQLPASVREGSSAQKDAFKAAMGFEQVLVRELVQELAKASPALSEGVHADAITDAMCAAVQFGGGLGLAAPLARTMTREEGA